MKLTYSKPAQEWKEALPIGCGRLGAMVYGGPAGDTVQFNEETLWDGHFDPQADNPETIAHLDEIRRAIFSGDYKTGQELTQKYMGEGSHYAHGAGYAYGSFPPPGI